MELGDEAKRSSVELRFLTDQQTSVLRHAGFANPFGADGVSTISELRGHWRAIDWILVRGDARVRFPQIHKSVSGPITILYR
jgi:hypothetical protein